MKNALSVTLLFVLVNIANCVAQVTIGSNDKPNSTLDVRGQGNVATSHDGIIAPRLTGDQLASKDPSAYGADQDGAIVYVTAAASVSNRTGKVINVKAPGYYYYDYADNVWEEIAQFQSQSQSQSGWFYMPPSLIDTDPGIGKTIDLFATYNASITNSIKSGSTDFSTIEPILTATDYDYYILGYDATLFANISLSTTGIMTYDVIGRATNESYITIAFAKKK